MIFIIYYDYDYKKKNPIYITKILIYENLLVRTALENQGFKIL